MHPVQVTCSSSGLGTWDTRHGKFRSRVNPSHPTHCSLHNSDPCTRLSSYVAKAKLGGVSEGEMENQQLQHKAWDGIVTSCPETPAEVPVWGLGRIPLCTLNWPPWPLQLRVTTQDVLPGNPLHPKFGEASYTQTTALRSQLCIHLSQNEAAWPGGAAEKPQCPYGLEMMITNLKNESFLPLRGDTNLNLWKQR